MVVLEWMAQKIIKRLEEEWKVVTLSRDVTANINHQLAMALEPVQKKFRKKERASRFHITKIEATTASI